MQRRRCCLSDGLPVPTSPNLNNEAQISAGNPNAWDFNMKATQVMQWSIGIQRELLPDLLLDVSYVGIADQRSEFRLQHQPVLSRGRARKARAARCSRSTSRRPMSPMRPITARRNFIPCRRACRSATPTV